jgi:hypothetical protein
MHRKLVVEFSLKGLASIISDYDDKYHIHNYELQE